MKWLLGVFLVLLWPAAGQADELRPGYLELTEQAPGQWRLAWKLPVTTAPVDALPAPTIPEICAFATEPEMGVAAAAIVGSGDLECDGPLGGEAIGMPGLLGQSDMLVRITPLDGEAQALRLTAREPSAMIAETPQNTQVWRTYFVIGVEHILAGWDHLVFVIALVLLIGKWRQVVIAATAFTVSHSITLAAASLGFVGLPQKPVEALIALSILFLALEIVRGDPEHPTLTRRHPWVVAFLFGLLHGFGFAGALAEIGLPQDYLVAALLAFNIGVEAGQLLVIAMLLGAIAAARKFAPAALSPAIRTASYGIGIIGAYWLIDRVVG